MLRAVYALSLTVALAGCAGGLNLGASPGVATPVLGGAVQIAPPRGYCLDRLTSRNQRDSAVLIFGTCEGLSEQGPRATSPAILTASVASGSSLGQTGLADLAAYFETPAGRRAIARSTGGAADIVSVNLSGGVLTVEARDNTDGKLAPTFWRGVFVQSGALVTVTVSAPASDPLDTARGSRLVSQFVASIRTATRAQSPHTPRATTQTTGQTTTQTTEGETPRTGLGDLFDRLR